MTRPDEKVCAWRIERLSSSFVVLSSIKKLNFLIHKSLNKKLKSTDTDVLQVTDVAS